MGLDSQESTIDGSSDAIAATKSSNIDWLLWQRRATVESFARHSKVCVKLRFYPKKCNSIHIRNSYISANRSFFLLHHTTHTHTHTHTHRHRPRQRQKKKKEKEERERWKKIPSVIATSPPLYSQNALYNHWQHQRCDPGIYHCISSAVKATTNYCWLLRLWSIPLSPLPCCRPWREMSFQMSFCE